MLSQRQIAEVDLDSTRSFPRQSQNWKSAGGLAICGCSGRGTDKVNLWMEVVSRAEMSLKVTLLDHEFGHLLGWQHHWPKGDGSGRAQGNWDENNPILPTRLFGWNDADGDGIAEILDPTPYGPGKN